MNDKRIKEILRKQRIQESNNGLTVRTRIKQAKKNLYMRCKLKHIKFDG